MTERRADRDAIYVEENVHEICQQLVEGNDPVNAPFRTMKDVFMWAASLGYRRGEKRPLSGKRVIVFRWAQLTSQTDVPLLKALAIADSGDVDVLLGQGEILTIAEEYANAGIHEVRARLLDEHGQPLWNLVGLLAQTSHDEQTILSPEG